MSLAPDVVLRPAAPEDVPDIVALMDSVQTWLIGRGQGGQWGETPFSRIPGFADRLAGWAAQGVVTVAERGDRIVGVLALATEASARVPVDLIPPGAWFVHTVVSARDSAGAGVGSLLLDEAERRARSASATAIALDHWAANTRLGELYSTRGYQEVGDYEETPGTTSTRNTVRVLRL